MNRPHILGGGNSGLPPGAAPQVDENQFDESAPVSGWVVDLPKDMMLCENVGQLGTSEIIKTVKQSNARDDKEWHMIIHKISPEVSDHFAKMNLVPGERVLISGGATFCVVNKMEFILMPFNAVKGILRRADGKLWVGSKFGENALAEGAVLEEAPTEG